VCCFSNFACIGLSDNTQSPVCNVSIAASNSVEIDSAGVFAFTWKNPVAIPTINGIIETCLYSSNMETSVSFYRDELGLRLLESGERLCVFSVAEKQVLLLFKRGGTTEPVFTPGGLIPPHNAAGQLHIAFAISAQEFDRWEEQLISRNIAIESKVTWPSGGRSLYFRDPDNHLLELATPGIWEIY
jgi:catechol 2,3-dioxygenase-like lactoylglutathione lyase family enzyme